MISLIKRGLWVIAAVAVAALGRVGVAQVTYPDRPAEGRCVVDAAGILTDEQERQIEEAARARQPSCDEVIVVTIESLAAMGADPAAGIEPYATGLFNHWRIGSSQRNRGVLLLVAVGDRKARIELGDGWPAIQKSSTDAIMTGTIVPRTRDGSYGAGLLEGVRAVGAMPVGATPSAFKAAPVVWVWGVCFGGAVVGAVVLVWLLRRSTSGRGSWGRGVGSTGAAAGYWSGYNGGGFSGDVGGGGFSGGGGGGDSGGSSSGGGSSGGW